MDRKPNIETKLICPECSAVVITPHPEIVLWERCPACSSHVWDDFDLMMAETIPVSEHRGRTINRHGHSLGRG